MSDLTEQQLQLLKSWAQQNKRFRRSGPLPISKEQAELIIKLIDEVVRRRNTIIADALGRYGRLLLVP